MQIARAKVYGRGNVVFQTADAYALSEALGRFDAAFAGFWWSHVPRERVADFVRSLHARLEPGAPVLLLDNRSVEGHSTPLVASDAAGNTYPGPPPCRRQRHPHREEFPDRRRAAPLPGTRSRLPGARLLLARGISTMKAKSNR